MPRCTTEKLPGLHHFPQLPIFSLHNNPSTIGYNSLSPSPNGAFKPVNSNKSLTVECSVSGIQTPQNSTTQLKSDTDITFAEPIATKRRLNACDEGDDRMRTVEERKARRAEKNRKFAKESRDRKRKHVQDLENEVKCLREQLENYKQRLKKYELIERHSNVLGKEAYNTLISVYQEMSQLDLPLTNHSAFIEALKKKVTEAIEEKKCALVQLAKAMVDIALPLPLRIAVWFNEKQVDIFDCEKTFEKFGVEVPANHIKALVKCMKELYPDKIKRLKMQNTLADIGKRIKSFMKQWNVMEYQNNVQRELMKYGEYVNTELLPDTNARVLEALISLSPYFNSIAEACQIGGINFIMSI